MSDINKVRHFLKDNEKSYREILTIVVAACEDLKNELGGQVVVRVYDRSTKQGGEPLKDAAKVLDACPRPVRTQDIKTLSDIIGVTIVVQYPDQVKLVLDRLKSDLRRKSLLEEKRKPHNVTYFAEHATYRSRLPVHGGLLCEVQCKTVLHDAWSMKMHDLTYKPLGSMDPRMAGLIEAISLSLEGLEQQSEIARDMILSRQRGERKPFQASLTQFLNGMESLLDTPENRARRTAQIDGLLHEVKEFVAGTGAEGSNDKAADLNGRILAALDTDVDAGAAWLIAVRFASALSAPDAHRFLNGAADELFDALAGLRRANLISEFEIRAIPMGFYTLQDFNRAVEYADKLIAARSDLHLTQECVTLLKYNKATWMLERESLKASKKTLAAGVRAEIEMLLTEVRPTILEQDPAVLKDTDGLLKIVYGDTKEEVRVGIDMCMEAGEPVKGDPLQTAVALAYAEWRNHVGWRRYFELAEI